jgi:putative transposase
MRKEGVAVRLRRRYRKTTDSKHGHPIAPNLLQRRFAIDSIRARDRVWASDITYIDTIEGWLYLAVVLDLRSRRVVGWSMSQSLETPIVLDALRMALSRRQPGEKGCCIILIVVANMRTSYSVNYSKITV